MTTRQMFPAPNITAFKVGDRVVSQAGTRFQSVGTVMRAGDIPNIEELWPLQVFDTPVMPDYLVVWEDEPTWTGHRIGFSWDSLLTRLVERKEVFYVAHPVSGDINANIANVVQWINWLTVNDPSRVYVAPWVAEVMAFKDDPLVVGADDTARKDFYDRVLEDDKEVVRRLDGILLVGGRISEGMRRELEAAEGKTVQDWSYARTPADLTPDHVEALGCQ